MITAKSLAATVALIEHATEPKSHLPILAQVRITAAAGGPLVVAGTDLTVDARAALGEHPAVDVLVDPRELRAALGTLPAGGPVTLVERGGSLAVRNCTTEAFVGLGGDPADFPAPMTEAKTATVEIPPWALREALAVAVTCASTDSTRWHLGGVSLGVEPAMDMGERLIPGGGMTLRAVAIDGHRLAIAERPVLGTQTIAPRLVPASACHCLVRALKNADSARVAMDGERLTVHIDGGTMGGGSEVRVKLLDTNFPPWRQVVPRSATTEYEIDRKGFAALCKSLASLAGKGKSAVGAGFVIVAGETLRIGVGPAGGDDKVVATPKTWRDVPGASRVRWENGAAPNEHGISIAYLRDALESLTGLTADRIRMDLNGPLDPVLLSSGSDGCGDRIVIMPMQI